MLIDLLSPLPGQPPITGSIDRLFTGNYKSNGNLVSLKVDVIDFTDFQRHGCLASPGPGSSQPHNHNITGTLFCHPDSNTVRLNITLLGPCNDNSKCWQNSPGSSPAENVTSKDVKSWNTEFQPLASSPIILGQHPQSNESQPKEVQYSVYSAPVSPPSQSQDVPPPLLDFHSEQLMSEIQNMTFDLKDHGISLTGQLYPENTPTSALSNPSLAQATSSQATIETRNERNGRVMSTASNIQPSQQTNPLVKPFTVSQATTFVLSQSTAKSSTAIAGQSVPSLTVSSPMSHPTLLQPKLERSDSICSDYTPLKEEFLSYTDELAGLDDLDNDNCLTPTSTSTLSSPLLFSPSQPNSILNSPDKNGIFFSKSFETKHQKSQNDAFDSLFSSSAASQSTTSHTFTNGNSYSMSLNESPNPYPLSHCGSPKPYAASQCCSPNSGASSDSQNISSPQETPITLLTSPKSRNRRNSSFDETKPHVCPQCGARFTTKSNLGQHAKIHLAVKPFICEICNHGFTRAAHYESHVAKHKGLKTHRCDQCGETFARLDNLLRHSARHKHGKIFDCATCGKGFHRKDKLLEHEKVHSEYTFPCQKCSKTFHTNDALKHHLPLHEDTTKTQCKICLKFITLKSLSKHMSAFHKEAVNNVNESNNNNLVSNNKSKSRSRTNNNPSNEKMHGCQYCKKSFVSPAKLRLHTAKYHAEERLNEAPPQIDTNVMSFNQTLTDSANTNNESRLRFFEENIQPRFPSPSSDGLPSQQVPEMELSYMNSSPEDISDFGNSKDLPGMSSNNYSIPTIHIPEFDNLQSKMGDNSEISTEAIQALFFS